MKEAIQEAINTWVGWHWWIRRAIPSAGQALVGFSIAMVSVLVVLVSAIIASVTSPFILIISVIFLVPAVLGYDWAVIAMPAFGKRFSSAPGAARLGTLKDLRNARLVGGRNRSQHIYCGKGFGETVYYAGPKHILTIGPTRAGKDARLLIPNLCQLDQSVVAMDPKGELAAVTARDRAKKGIVIIINPCGVLYRDCDPDNNWNQKDLDDPKKTRSGI
jgi:type IV secretory pathway TraG/TraD family ATPase VirD4